jgi:hypothetical protein
MGQVSGIAFIFGMDGFKSGTTGSMTYPLMVMAGLMVLSFFISYRLKESQILSGIEPVVSPGSETEAVSAQTSSDNYHAKK